MHYKNYQLHLLESSLFVVSDTDVLDPPSNISVSFTPDGSTFHGHLSWNLAPHSEQKYVIILLSYNQTKMFGTNLHLGQFFMQANNQKQHVQPLPQLHIQYCTH